MKLKDVKKEIYSRLIQEKPEDVVKYLKSLDKKEIEDDIFTKCYAEDNSENIPDEKFEKSWTKQHTNTNYYASNLGRIKFEGEIVPQHQDENYNWCINTTSNVYDYVADAWMQREKENVEKLFPNEKIELHHIFNEGDNRIDNMVYLPNSIHKFL